MSSRWPGSLISPTAPTPSGGGAGDSAPGVWTLDQIDPYVAAGNWPGLGTPDPQFQYVTALLHGDGADGAQNNTFLDSSTNNFTITRNGNTTQGSFSPYGNFWSNYFNGTGYLSAGSNSNFAFGTNAYTVEMWVNPSAISQQVYIFNDTTGGFGFYFETSGSAGFTLAPRNGAAILTGGYSALTANTWNHIAIVRSSTSANATSIFVNGNRVANGTDSTNWSITGPLLLGGLQANIYQYAGYISNCRVVNGFAVYSPSATTITVPNAPLTAIANTVFLSCQSNRFIDTSATAATVTPSSGNQSVQRFSPFQNLATYQTAKIGGSGYFDGTGDYLNATLSTALGTGDFTVEGWVNSSNVSYASQKGWLQLSTSAGGLSTNTSGGLWILFGNTSEGKVQVSINNSDIFSTNTVAPNTWNHIAVTRQSGTVRLFVNGVLEGSNTNTANLTATYLCIGGYYSTSYLLPGYVTDFRIVNSALYTSAFTPNTTPLTAVSGTQILTNFTNGALYDNSEINDFETVGSAAISTTQSKFGGSSIYLPTGANYLKSASNRNFYFGTSNFTVEFWLYYNSSTAITYGTFFDNGGQGVFLSYGSVGTKLLFYGVNAQTDVSGFNHGMVNGTWNHCAFVRNGTTLTIYVNGVSIGSYTGITGSMSPLAGYTNAYIGAYSGDVTSYSPATYIDDFRVTTGYARYWFNFQPPSAPYPNYGGTLQLTYDPYFYDVPLLLNGEGTNGAQNNTFLDSSSNAFTITRNGNTTQGSFSPYGNLWSNYFNAGGVYPLAIPQSTNTDLGSGDFTVEAWAFANSFGSYYNVIGCKWEYPNKEWLFDYNASGITFALSTDGQNDSAVFTASATIALNTWYHIAVSRSGSSLYFFLNGKLISTQSITQTCYPANIITTIGQFPYNGVSDTGMRGYISNFRLVKGTAVYTSNFTPSTAPLTAISGTQILTCQSNRFQDNSPNNFTVTPTNSNNSVQRFSPFNPTSTYSTSVIGGSGYFDGSSYLRMNDNAAFQLGSSDFTLETWVYLTATPPVYDASLLSYGTSGNFNGWQLSLSNGAPQGSIVFSFNYSTVVTSTLATKLNSWNHVAVSRSGNTLYLFVNGVLDSATSFTATSNTGSSDYAYIGTSSYDPGSSQRTPTGYLCGSRLVKGTCLYTSTFTLPTVPVSPVTNTSYLLGYTNAGIPDLAMQNDLQTVGNAQVSTTQFKYGSSSLYFDGSSYLQEPSNPNWDFGTGDFTVELWAYLNSTSGYPSFVLEGTGVNGSPVAVMGWGVYYFSGNLYLTRYDGSTSTVYSFAWTPSTGTWYHIAVSRASSSLRAFINGNQIGSTQTSTDNFSRIDTTTPFWIGRFGGNGTLNNYLNGYIDDLRITKGLARYVQPFTPPTAAFPTY